MSFSKSNNSSMLQDSLKIAISGLRSTYYQFDAYRLLSSINNTLSSYRFFSSASLRLHINLFKRSINDNSAGSPVPLTSADITGIDMIIAELETFLNE